MNSWMKRLNRIGPDSTRVFKYILPSEIYYLIDYTVIRKNQFMTEFFSDNTRQYKNISRYFKEQDYPNIKVEYEPKYNCWCTEIIDPRIQVLLDEFYDPYHYMGEETYINNALDKGYDDLEMIKKTPNAYLVDADKHISDIQVEVRQLLNKHQI